MNHALTIGILGGMGPDATNRLAELITLMTPAVQDQDHIPVITYNNSKIPSRVEAILRDGPSPAPEMVRSARVLEAAGADLIIVPCNCAHFYLDAVQRSVSIPVLNMIEQTVKYTVKHFPEAATVGLLASTATIASELYSEPLARHGRNLLTPAREEQEEKVMEAIYGPWGIKAGFRTKPRALLTEVAQSLVDRGADLLIAGCTEVSLVIAGKRSPFPVVDPMEVIARAAVRFALSGTQVKQQSVLCPSGQLTLVTA
ncbi:MAG TPA: amino acid racemase [Candidatus Obscuribacterales bacterium]